MGVFTVTMPIAGHAVRSVEAKDRAEAIQKAFENVTLSDIESWEALDRFHQGNISHCPQPWEVTVENEDGEEIEDDDQ
jgi:hypothetical protein